MPPFDPAVLVVEAEHADFERWALTADGGRRHQDLQRTPATPGALAPVAAYLHPAVERDWRVWRARGRAGRGLPVAATDGVDIWWLPDQPGEMSPVPMPLYAATDALAAGSAALLARHAVWLESLGWTQQAALVRTLANGSHEGGADPDAPEPVPAVAAGPTADGGAPYLDAADMAALRRFGACCREHDRAGHDVPAPAMRRLADIGAVRAAGPRRYVLTSFGEYALGLHAQLGWALPLKTYAEYCALLGATPARAGGLAMAHLLALAGGNGTA